MENEFLKNVNGCLWNYVFCLKFLPESGSAEYSMRNELTDDSSVMCTLCVDIYFSQDCLFMWCPYLMFILDNNYSWTSGTASTLASFPYSYVHTVSFIK